MLKFIQLIGRPTSNKFDKNKMALQTANNNTTSGNEKIQIESQEHENVEESSKETLQSLSIAEEKLREVKPNFQKFKDEYLYLKMKSIEEIERNKNKTNMDDVNQFHEKTDSDDEKFFEEINMDIKEIKSDIIQTIKILTEENAESEAKMNQLEYRVTQLTNGKVELEKENEMLTNEMEKLNEELKIARNELAHCAQNHKKRTKKQSGFKRIKSILLKK